MSDRGCKKLIEYALTTKHKSKWLKSEIRKFEKIEHPSNKERWTLCSYYSVLTSVPFDSDNVIYSFCEGCEHGDLFLRGHGLNSH